MSEIPIDNLEKEIMYFISSHSIHPGEDKKPYYIRPVLPHPQMGEQFCENIRIRHDFIDEWIQLNPEKFELAQRGYHKKPT